MMNDSFSPGWGFVLYPLFGCCLSVLLTRVCIRVLPRLGYVDKPGGTYFGFLRCNFLPARIFFGDSVSTLLGLIFAIIGLSTVDRAVIAASLLLRLSCVRRQPAARGYL